MSVNQDTQQAAATLPPRPALPKQCLTTRPLPHDLWADRYERPAAWDAFGADDQDGDAR